MQRYSELYTTYKRLFEEKKKIDCLRLLGENGFCIPRNLLKSFNTKSQRRQKVLENYITLKDFNFDDWGQYEIQYPEAECAVYDFSNRIKTKRKCLMNFIYFMNYFIPPHEIYMYNPIGGQSGYNYYCGQKVIVYQITPEMNELEKFTISKEIKKTTIKNYHIDNPILFVYKIILVTTSWESKYDWIHFDMGIDTDNFCTLFNDAWNGKMHVWTYKDGSYISPQEREHLLKEQKDEQKDKKVKISEKEKKGRKKKEKIISNPIVNSEDEQEIPIEKPKRRKKRKPQRKLAGFVEI